MSKKFTMKETVTSGSWNGASHIEVDAVNIDNNRVVIEIDDNGTAAAIVLTVEEAFDLATQLKEILK